MHTGKCRAFGGMGGRRSEESPGDFLIAFLLQVIRGKKRFE